MCLNLSKNKRTEINHCETQYNRNIIRYSNNFATLKKRYLGVSPLGYLSVASHKKHNHGQKYTFPGQPKPQGGLNG